MTRKTAAFLLGLVVFGGALSLLLHQGIIKGSDTELAFLITDAQAQTKDTPIPQTVPAADVVVPAPFTARDYLAAMLLTFYVTDDPKSEIARAYTEADAILAGEPPLAAPTPGPEPTPRE